MALDSFDRDFYIPESNVDQLIYVLESQIKKPIKKYQPLSDNSLEEGRQKLTKYFPQEPSLSR